MVRRVALHWPSAHLSSCLAALIPSVIQGAEGRSLTRLVVSGAWAVQHLTKAGVVNVEKPQVGTLVACCLRKALDVSLEVSRVHGSQVAQCNQPFPCSGPSDIYATVDGTVIRQSNVLYSLERKTAGVTAHYDPVQDMTSLVHWHVHELSQVVVVQQSLQLVNIAIRRVFKMKVKITNKREISACMTVFRNQRWEFFKKHFV